MLETRNLEAIIFAYNYALNNKLFDSDNLEEYLIAHLQLVGFTKREGDIESYCPNSTRHFSFKKNYFSAGRAIHLSKEQHPTWSLIPGAAKYKFGGILQDDENNPFIHLITFNEIPEAVKITGLASLTLGMHIRELNEYGAIFYQHDDAGKPGKIGKLNKIELYSDLPIEETEISLADTPGR